MENLNYTQNEKTTKVSGGSPKKNKIEDKIKKWLVYIVAFIFIAFGQALIKTLVEERHNNKKTDLTFYQFDNLMRKQANDLNSRLPLRIDEYTTCISIEYLTKNGRVLLTKYQVSDEIADEAKKASVMQELKKGMMESMQVQYENTKEATELMIRCNMMYKYEYYDSYGTLLNSYVLFPNEVVGLR